MIHWIKFMNKHILWGSLLSGWRCYYAHYFPVTEIFYKLIAYSYLYDNHGRIHIMLSNGTEFTINEALYSPSSRRTFLRFKDIRTNDYHVETIEKEKGVECLCITSNLYGQKRTLEKLKCLSNGRHMTTIKSIEPDHLIS